MKSLPVLFQRETYEPELISSCILIIPYIESSLGYPEEKLITKEKFLDAGIQDVSTSISIVLDLTEKHKFSKGGMTMLVMKVTNIYKHEIVDTRA